MTRTRFVYVDTTRLKSFMYCSIDRWISRCKIDWHNHANRFVYSRASSSLERERYPSDWGGHRKDSGDAPRWVGWAPLWFVRWSFGWAPDWFRWFNESVRCSPECFRQVWKVVQPPKPLGRNNDSFGYSSLRAPEARKSLREDGFEKFILISDFVLLCL